MVKAIHVICTKASVDDKWPIFPNLYNVDAFKKALPSIGIIEYVKKNVAESSSFSDLNRHLVIDQYFVFPNDRAFVEHKDFAYAHIPLWKFDSESEARQYYTDNHITVTFEEVDTPDLTDYKIPLYVYEKYTES